MSFYSLFGPVIQRLRGNKWGTSITLDGSPKDTAVDPAIQEVANMLADTGPIDLAGTLEFNNSGDGAAIAINSMSSNTGFTVNGPGGSSTLKSTNGLTIAIPFASMPVDPLKPPFVIAISECAVKVKYHRRVLAVANGFVTGWTGDDDDTFSGGDA